MIDINTINPGDKIFRCDEGNSLEDLLNGNVKVFTVLSTMEGCVAIRKGTYYNHIWKQDLSKWFKIEDAIETLKQASSDSISERFNCCCCEDEPEEVYMQVEKTGKDRVIFTILDETESETGLSVLFNARMIQRLQELLDSYVFDCGESNE